MDGFFGRVRWKRGVLWAAFGVLACTLSLLAVANTGPVRRFAEQRARVVLFDLLGVEATFDVSLEFFPPRVVTERVVLPATDGGAPFLTAERISLAPGWWRLLHGEFLAEELSVLGANVRVVIRDGKLANWSARAPESRGTADAALPFRRLHLSGGALSLDVDGRLLEVGSMEFAVDARRPAYPRVELNVADGAFQGGDATQDVLCMLHLDAEAQLGPGLKPLGLNVTKLSALGALGLTETEEKNTGCNRARLSEHRLEIGATAFRVTFPEGAVPQLRGHVRARAPLSVVQRFLPVVPLGGWAHVEGEVEWDGSRVLPRFRGEVRADHVQVGSVRLATSMVSEVVLDADTIRIPQSRFTFAEGAIQAHDVAIRPLESPPTLSVRRVDNHGIQFPAMMSALGVTDDTIVSWDLGETVVEDVSATLQPFRLDASVTGRTGRFAIFDSSFRDAARQRVIGFDSGTLSSQVVVTADALEFRDVAGAFGQSKLSASLVSIGLSEPHFKLRADGSNSIEISDLGPVAGIPMSGRARLRIFADAPFEEIVLSGSSTIDDFRFAGLSFGDLATREIKFWPLVLELRDTTAKKLDSQYATRLARVDFNASPAIVFDADMHSDAFGLRDLLDLLGMNGDPRYQDFSGRGPVSATIHYESSGPRDRCGDGYLSVQGQVEMGRSVAFGERYDSVRAGVDFTLFDPRAGYRGMTLDLTGLTVTEGAGILTGGFKIRPGGVVDARLIGSTVPLRNIDHLGTLGYFLPGDASVELSASGTLDALSVDARVNVTPIRFGTTYLGPSELAVSLRPTAGGESISTGTTSCGNLIPGRFNLKEWERDVSQGLYTVNGALFGGQIQLSKVQLSQQRQPHVSGDVAFVELDLTLLASLLPGLSKGTGALTAQLHIDDLSVQSPEQAQASLLIEHLLVNRQGFTLAVGGSAPVQMSGGRIWARELNVRAGMGGEVEAAGLLRATLDDLGGNPTVNGAFTVAPSSVGALLAQLPGVEAAEGTARADIRFHGPLASPQFMGDIAVTDASLRLEALPGTLSHGELMLRLERDQLKLVRGGGRFGGGPISLSGSAKFVGLGVEDVQLSLAARGVRLRPSDGVQITSDANLRLEALRGGSAERGLPRLTGDVVLRDFLYTRPVRLAGDFSRAPRSSVASYDPTADRLQFDVRIHSERPMKLSNNLLDAELLMSSEGLLLSGTDQRFGMRGQVAVRPGGRFRLRRSTFEIREGRIDFDDLTRVAPKVDVSAVTQYRRTASVGSGDDADEGSPVSPAGRWLITLRARGDTEDLKVALSSEPGLSQADIFLLLTVGLTRAELEQARAASLGSSVAIEAVGALSGADQALADAIPLIDDFSFGSAYSPATGRTEPTVSVGKRVTDRVRANVTSGVTGESQEVRSNVEWRLSDSLSVEGSYDNVNDLAGSPAGNVGADVRFRIEFE